MKHSNRVLAVFLLALLLCACAEPKPENVIEDIAFSQKQRYIREHLNSLQSVTQYHVTLGGDVETPLEPREAADSFLGVETVAFSGISVTDDYYTYSFLFDNGEEICFNFENIYYCEGPNTYMLEGFSHFRPENR